MPDAAPTKSQSRLHAPRAAIPAGTKISIRRKCEKRLLKINYPGSGNYSQFVYDPWGRNAKITEYASGSLISTKQFVWYGVNMSEARDASGTIINQYFLHGQNSSGTNYFFTRDQLGSVRDVTNNSGVLQAVYSYDPYGRLATLSGSSNADFLFANYYYHAPSGLSMTVNRAYSANS
jgi:hypothetical protein